METIDILLTLAILSSLGGIGYIIIDQISQRKSKK